MKKSITLTQDEIEYLADLLDYEIFDPEPRLANHLEPEQIEKLRDMFRKKSAYIPLSVKRIQSA
jgi:hypothetical protein